LAVVSSSQVSEFCPEKHCTVLVIIKQSLFEDPPYERTVMRYDQVDCEDLNIKIKRELENIDYNMGDVDRLARVFTEKLLKAEMDSIPSKKIKVNPEDKPWMNNNIRQQIIIRKELLKKLKKDKSDLNYENFRIQRNVVSNLIRKTKEEYWEFISCKLANQETTNKDWHKIIKNVIKKT
jgi:hypothetical protein